MRKILFLFFLFCTHLSFAQTGINFDTITLDKKGDYKIAEPAVLEAANYVLTHPHDQNDLLRLKSVRFVIKWMTGTPDFNFNFDQEQLKPVKGNDDLLMLYMMGLTKNALENPELARDDKSLSDSALTAVINYCEDPSNNIKMTKGLRKLAASKKK